MVNISRRPTLFFARLLLVSARLFAAGAAPEAQPAEALRWR
jgi:hypothetical protein